MGFNVHMAETISPASPELTKRFAVFLKGVLDHAGFPPGKEGDELRRQLAGRFTREFRLTYARRPRRIVRRK